MLFAASQSAIVTAKPTAICVDGDVRRSARSARAARWRVRRLGRRTSLWRRGGVRFLRREVAARAGN